MSPRPVVVDHLYIPKIDITEEDAIGSCCLLLVVKSQRNDVLKVGRVLEGPDRRVEVPLVGQVDTLENGSLGVEQIAVVPVAPEPVLSQITVGTGACPPAATQVETQLLAATIVTPAGVRT